METEPSADALSTLRAAETIERPVGSAEFLEKVTVRMGRNPRPLKRGPKQK